MKISALIIALLIVLPVGGVSAAEMAWSGASLYQENCARCHGTLEKTRIPNRSARRIASAINTMGIMASLRNLSPEQIDLISAALQKEEKLFTRK